MNKNLSRDDGIVDFPNLFLFSFTHGVGSMTYDNSAKPYQVTMLSPQGNAVLLREQTISYTSFQRPSRINENALSASFTYNAAGDRVKMYVANGTTPVLTRYYIGGQ